MTAKEIVYIGSSPYICLGKEFLDKHPEIRKNGYSPIAKRNGDILLKVAYKYETDKKE